jgi:hypothetical protein
LTAVSLSTSIAAWAKALEHYSGIASLHRNLPTSPPIAGYLKMPGNLAIEERVVADAVDIEPVSILEIPVFGEKPGNFRNFEVASLVRPDNRPRISRSCHLDSRKALDGN